MIDPAPHSRARRVLATSLTLISAILVCCVAGCVTVDGSGSSSPAGAQKDTAEVLFVQTAESVTFQGGELTLHNVSPSTLWFTDRPERMSGHQDTKVFVEDWARGPDSFAADAPNADLSILGDDRTEVAQVVAELHDPRLNGRDLTYRVEVLEGTPPARGNVSALFIDALVVRAPARLYAPVAVRPYGAAGVAGVARRTARRTTRRVMYRR